MRALFFTAVWGQKYIERFLDYSLRSQITSGNIGIFDKESLYLILCHEEDVAQILEHEVYKQLSELVSVEIKSDFDLSDFEGDKYQVLSVYQSYALQRSRIFDVVFFGYADMVWADGSYASAMERISQGYEVVFSYGLNVLEDDFSALAQQYILDEPGSPLAIPNRKLAKYVYDHLHPQAASCIWDGRESSSIGALLLWKIQNQGYLLSAFHIHPVVMVVKQTDLDFLNPFQISLDDEFVGRNYCKGSAIYVNKSTDDMFCLALEKNFGIDYRRKPIRRQNAGDIAEFAETYTGIVHREMITRTMRIVIDDVVEEEWAEAEASQKQIVSEVLRRLNITDSILEIEAPLAYVARRNRLRLYGNWLVPDDSVEEKIKRLIQDYASRMINEFIVSLDIAEKSTKQLEKEIENKILRELVLKHLEFIPDKSDNDVVEEEVSLEELAQAMKSQLARSLKKDLQQLLEQDSEMS